MSEIIENKCNSLVFDCQLQFFMLPTNLGIRSMMMQFLIKFNRYTYLWLSLYKIAATLQKVVAVWSLINLMLSRFSFYLIRFYCFLDRYAFQSQQAKIKMWNSQTSALAKNLITLHIRWNLWIIKSLGYMSIVQCE